MMKKFISSIFKTREERNNCKELSKSLNGVTVNEKALRQGWDTYFELINEGKDHNVALESATYVAKSHESNNEPNDVKLPEENKSTRRGTFLRPPLESKKRRSKSNGKMPILFFPKEKDIDIETVEKNDEKKEEEQKTQDPDNEEPDVIEDVNYSKGKFLLFALLAIIGAIALLVFINVKFNVNNIQTPIPSPEPTYVGKTWLMQYSDYANSNNRLWKDGVEEIKNAKTDSDAAIAGDALLEKVKIDPNYLVAFANIYLKKNVDVKTLIDEHSWATNDAVQLLTELQITFAKATITLAEAPSNSYNTGVNKDGVVVGSELPGITGNRKAIQIKLSDGSLSWNMGRCGNIVTPGKPPFPPGKTDETPPPVPTLQPKSSNPDDYKQPGDDEEKDSGTGKKPIVPFVTAPPELSPPPVETSRPGGGGVVDSPINTPGSESGVIAPGAKTPQPGPKPTPEPGVNPTETGKPNQGDPGNPFG